MTTPTPTATPPAPRGTAPAGEDAPTLATVVEDLTVHVHRGDGTTGTYSTTAVLDAGSPDRAAHHRASLAGLCGVPASAIAVLPGAFTYSIDLTD